MPCTCPELHPVMPCTSIYCAQGARLLVRHVSGEGGLEPDERALLRGEYALGRLLDRRSRLRGPPQRAPRRRRRAPHRRQRSARAGRLLVAIILRSLPRVYFLDWVLYHDFRDWGFIQGCFVELGVWSGSVSF